jgi:hypothetical protein
MTKLQRFEQANHFEFSGEGLSGMLDTNSIDGQPLGSVTVDGVEGRMVSIRQGPGGWHLDAELVAIPDLSVETVQVVLPQVNLEGEAVSFNGYAVLLTTRTSIGGAALVPGPLQHYELRGASGVATLALVSMALVVPPSLDENRSVEPGRGRTSMALWSPSLV